MIGSGSTAWILLTDMDWSVPFFIFKIFLYPYLSETSWLLVFIVPFFSHDYIRHKLQLLDNTSSESHHSYLGIYPTIGGNQGCVQSRYTIGMHGFRCLISISLLQKNIVLFVFIYFPPTFSIHFWTIPRTMSNEFKCQNKCLCAPHGSIEPHDHTLRLWQGSLMLNWFVVL